MNKSEDKVAKGVRTRFAPSPTGFLHVGSLRTAVYAYALAKHSNGNFLLRIEDTDQSRLIEGATENIFSTLRKFNVMWDEGPDIGGPHEPYIQSERVVSGIYQKAADKLLKDGHAFYCFCKPQSREELKENWEKKKIELRDSCRDMTKTEIEKHLSNGDKPAIRLKVPDNEKISFYDFAIKKEAVWNSKDVDDAMLLKSDGFPTYHLAVVVDDHDMQISHIVRAMEWFSSTPIHVLVHKYLGLTMPQIGHPSSILDPTGGKLSKRKRNAMCEDFLADGYLPEALLNFVILLGWAPKDNRELYTLSEYVKAFDIDGFQKSNPVFDTNKLDWFNGYYIRQKNDQELARLLEKFAPESADKDLLIKIAPLVKERIKKLSEFDELAGFFFKKPEVDASLFTEYSEKHIKAAAETFEHIGSWKLENLNENLMVTVTKNEFKTGKFFMDLRIAITGKKISPPINESMIILGKEETLTRLRSVQK